MKIQFNKTTTLSYDGVNTRTYLQGQVYQASHAQERRVFEGALSKGDAVPFGVAQAPVEVKVQAPVERKEVAQETAEHKKVAKDTNLKKDK